MARIVFIGLGKMGSPMAVNLQRAGHRVQGYNRTPGKTEPLTSAGGEAATSIEQAVSGADIIATMFPDSPDVVQVMRGTHDQPGVLDLVEPGTLLIDFSTIRRDVTIDLVDEARQKQIGLLDAPVSGGQAGAEAATLSIMVGGEASDFTRALPMLQDVGRTIVHVGGHGAGQLVKAANQLIVAANIRGARRGDRFPRCTRRRARTRSRCHRRRIGRLVGIEPEAHQHARAQLRSRVPDRAAP